MTLGLYERAWDLTSKPRNTPVVQASAHGFSAFDKCFELDLGTTPLSSPSRRRLHTFHTTISLSRALSPAPALSLPLPRSLSRAPAPRACSRSPARALAHVLA